MAPQILTTHEVMIQSYLTPFRYGKQAINKVLSPQMHFKIHR